LTFSEKLRAAQARHLSWLCVGLDPDPAKIPAGWDVVAFNRAIVEATRDLVCAYKPNLAFYLARGSKGIDELAQTFAAIPRDIPIVLDAKFGDIESSARGYARFAFTELGADAVTVSPYLGTDALAPFLEFSNRAIFLLAHTSNASAREVQDLLVAAHKLEALPEPLSIHVAHLAAELRGAGETGLVVGATFPEQLHDTRLANARAIFLIPGIGAQGGSLRDAATFGVNADGIGPLINASRAILYAARDQNFADAARIAAQQLRDDINAARKSF
jgi:orotidine-5'-phosphate decarboxylase